MDQLDKPNVSFPLALSYDTRGITGYTHSITNALDQRKVNAIYLPYRNAMTQKTTLRVAKRPGVGDSGTGSTWGDSGQVTYLSEIAPGAENNTDHWVFSKSGNDIRASSTSDTTVILTDATAWPSYVDKTKISGADTLVVQISDTAGSAQKTYYSTAIATFTEISNGTFAALSHRGKAEHINGYMFISTPTRIHNSDLNSLANWSAIGYIDRQITQDIGTGLAKIKNQLISFGAATMEVFAPTSNPTGSPLESISHLTQNDVGMDSCIGGAGASPSLIAGTRHYYTTVGDRIYWRGNPVGVYSWDGQRVEKVSTPGIDAILQERQFYYVSRLNVLGNLVVSIGLDLPNAATQRALIFSPEWKDWFEWSSTVFIPQAGERDGTAVFGVGANSHTRYRFGWLTNNQGLGNTWNDNGTDYTATIQFRMPRDGNHLKRMSMFGLTGTRVTGTNSPGSSDVGVSFSDDDGSNWSAERTIDMSAQKKAIYGCGAYRDRLVRLTAAVNASPIIENVVARVD